MTWQIIEHAANGKQVINTDVSPPESWGDGWAVIADDVGEPPEDGAWDGTAWVIDQARVSAKNELDEVLNKKRLMQALKSARNRIIKLENKQDQLISAVQALRARVTTLEGN